MNYTLIKKNLFCLNNGLQLLKRSTSKIAVQIDDQVLQKLENNDLKPRKHPGVGDKKKIQLPEEITNAIKKVTGDYPIKALLLDGKKLDRYIAARHPPLERQELRLRVRKIVEEVDEKFVKPENFTELTEEEQLQWKTKRQKLIQKFMKQRNYAWKPITYGNYEALVYAVVRGVKEYAVLTNILKEIATRDDHFKPQSYFDFGSGIGTGIWAASRLWRDHIYEYYNVDASRDMNNLSELILCDGNDNQQMSLRNVYYRQFLPGLDTKYDLVVCAYTLFELPGAQQRQEALLNLWRRCDKYLLLVEEGSLRGCELINEARDYLLSLGAENEDLRGHVFAPCAHDEVCPRLANNADKTPCNFEITYKPLDVGDTRKDVLTSRYSYVVLKKGPITDETRSWPRLVRPTLLRHKHVICHTCTADARLQEVIFTQSKHGRMAYRCAKASRWGDRLPMAIGQPFNDKNNNSDEIVNVDEIKE